MTARWAYWSRDVGLMQCEDAPQFKRLRRAWPNLPDSPTERWQAQAHPVQGTMIVWPRQPDGAAVSLSDFGEPRETFDGLTYYPSKEQATLTDLIRPDTQRGDGTWIQLVNGESFFVALATATPRELVIRPRGPVSFGTFQNEYGLLGHQLFDLFNDRSEEGGLRYADERMSRLLFLVYQESYQVTEEMVEDRRDLSSADIGPLLHGTFGMSPKASAVAPAGSASADQTSQTSP